MRFAFPTYSINNLTTMELNPFRIDSLPAEEQAPFLAWLMQGGHTQPILDESDPAAYAWRIDYREWKRTLAYARRRAEGEITPDEHERFTAFVALLGQD
jgi:hypothetical protein